MSRRKPLVRLVPKSVPGGAEVRTAPPNARVFECSSVAEIAMRVGRYRKDGGSVLQFDDPIHQHIGFCSEDMMVEWRLPVAAFFRHFESRPALIKAFAQRKEYVFELGAALTA